MKEERKIMDTERILANIKKKSGFQVNEIGKFWVVIKATKDSELIDILFETDVFKIMMQAKGGLKKEDIIGIYKHKSTATRIAEKMLQEKE